MEEARHYLIERRLNFMAVRRPAKPDSSFVGGKALRAQIEVWQDGHADSTRTECGLDTMSDVNLALAELLHDVHDIIIDRVNGCAGRTAFAREGTLKVLHEGEVHSLPALAAPSSQLPRSCDVLLGVPGLDALGVSTEGKSLCPSLFSRSRSSSSSLTTRSLRASWTHAQKNILTQWAQAGLKDGSLELSNSWWASRPHIVMKTPANQHKDLVYISKCKLRVCGDYRAVNTQIAKIVPNLPTGLEEVEKAAGHRLYWESDSVACYSQFTLAPGRSREALAIWTPLGLVQPTTLPLGQKNSGTDVYPSA
jgi:hypothetical protein